MRTEWMHPSQCKWCDSKFAATTWDGKPIDECFACWRKIHKEHWTPVRIIQEPS